jgi:hypothetical protein
MRQGRRRRLANAIWFLKRITIVRTNRCGSPFADVATAAVATAAPAVPAVRILPPLKPHQREGLSL